MKATAKQIFNHIQMLNPKSNCISSIGQYISESDKVIANSMYTECINGVMDNSFAKKILLCGGVYSDKQLWVIAYELEKNEDYATKLFDYLQNLERKNVLKREEKHKKNLVNKLAKENIAKNTNINSSYAIGDNVNHPQFGNGVINMIDNTIITVLFVNFGEKKLVKSFAKLFKTI